MHQTHYFELLEVIIWKKMQQKNNTNANSIQ